MKQKILNYLRQSFGIEGEDALELYSSFIATLDENISKFDSYIDEENYADLARTAHTIKGCAMNSGHQEMAQIALKVEMAAKNKNKPDCKLFSAKLKELYSVLE